MESVPFRIMMYVTLGMLGLYLAWMVLFGLFSLGKWLFASRSSRTDNE